MASVLIIENNTFFRKSFKEILKMYLPQLPIEEAASAREGLEKIDERLPDIIFMDIHLSGKNGLELSREIKRNHPDIVVNIFTNYDLPEYRETAYRYGVDHFILKDALSGAAIAELIMGMLEDKKRAPRPTLCGFISTEYLWGTSASG